jgi:hypothetical protein
LNLKETMMKNKDEVINYFLKKYFHTLKNLTTSKYDNSIIEAQKTYIISDEESKEYRDKFFKEFPSLKVFIERNKELESFGNRSLKAFKNQNPDITDEIKSTYFNNLADWITQVEKDTPEYFKRMYLFEFMSFELFGENIFEVEDANI